MDRVSIVHHLRPCDASDATPAAVMRAGRFAQHRRTARYQTLSGRRSLAQVVGVRNAKREMTQLRTSF